MRTRSRIVIVLFTALMVSTMFAPSLPGVAAPGRTNPVWFFGIALLQIGLLLTLAYFVTSTSGERDDDSAPAEPFNQSRWDDLYPDTPAPPVSQPPELSALLGAAMDRVNAVVKDTILDWKPELPEEDAEPEEEIALCPLDRPRFVAELSAKFTPALEYIAETVAAPRTNFDLAKTEIEVGHFLHELRWDALNLALEQRAPDEARAHQPASTVSIPPPRRWPPEKPAVPPSGGWGKKYRRMRALGF